MRNQGTEQEMQVLQQIVKVLTGIIVSFGVCFLCLIVFSLGISNGLLSESWMKSLTLTACVLGSGAGGWITAQRSKGYRLLTGTMVGGGLFLMIMAVGCAFYQSVSVVRGGLCILIGCLCGGALSGLLAGARIEKGKGRIKKRKKR